MKSHTSHTFLLLYISTAAKHAAAIIATAPTTMPAIAPPLRVPFFTANTHQRPFNMTASEWPRYFRNMCYIVGSIFMNIIHTSSMTTSQVLNGNVGNVQAPLLWIKGVYYLLTYLASIVSCSWCCTLCKHIAGDPSSKLRIVTMGIWVVQSSICGHKFSPGGGASWPLRNLILLLRPHDTCRQGSREFQGIADHNVTAGRSCDTE